MMGPGDTAGVRGKRWAAWGGGCDLADGRGQRFIRGRHGGRIAERIGVAGPVGQEGRAEAALDFYGDGVSGQRLGGGSCRCLALCCELTGPVRTWHCAEESPHPASLSARRPTLADMTAGQTGCRLCAR